MSHLPKYAMLIGLAQGRMSPSGETRARTHIDRCEVCASAWQGLQRYEVLAQAAREIEPMHVDYDRVALSLRRQAREYANAKSQRTLIGALAIAALIGLAVFTAARLSAPVETAQSDALLPTPSTARESDLQQASASTGTSNPAPSASPAETATNSVTPRKVAEGDVLSAEGNDVRIEVWSGTSLLLHAGTLARVVKLQGRQLRVAIERGAITSEVAPLNTHDSFEIAVRNMVVAVRGTHFRTELDRDGRAHVVLREGSVEVSRNEHAIARLQAPAEWTDERAPQLHHDLDTHEANGALKEPVPVTERSLAVASPRTAGTKRGEVAPAVVRNLVARAGHLLRACHDQSRRIDPTTPSAVTLMLTVNDAGTLQSFDARATDAAAAIPGPMVNCMRTRVTTWHVPLAKPGTVTLDIPLVFATSP